MSVEKHYEVMTRTVTESVYIGETTYCDVCKKEINTNKGYYELTTGHNDWDNDSCESIEHFDICSRTCLMNKFTEYLDESNANDWNTKYFNVERA